MIGLTDSVQIRSLATSKATKVTEGLSNLWSILLGDSGAVVDLMGCIITQL